MKKFISLMASVAMIFCAIATPVHASSTSVSDEQGLREAIATGGTIVVTEDIELTESIRIPTGTAVVLDLNGHTISQTKACTGSYEMINVDGSLTVTGNGKLSFKDTGEGDPNFGWGSYTIRNGGGTLVIENGTIEHLGQQEKHCIQAIFQYDGNTTINGGTISTPNYRSVRLWSGKMVINGGTFEGRLWVQCVNDKADLTIKGGTFTPKPTDETALLVSNKSNSVALNVTGGQFNGKFDANDTSKLAGTISGGTYTNDVSALLVDGYALGEKEDGTYVVAAPLQTLIDEANAGDKITLMADYTVDEVLKIEKSITIDGNGHSVKGSAKKTFEINNSTDTAIDVVFENMTIDNSFSGGRSINTRNDDINVTVKNCVLNTTASGNNQTILVGGTDTSGTTVTVENSTINAGRAGYGIITFVKSEVTVKNSTINGYAAIYVKHDSSASRFVIEGSTLNGINPSNPAVETNDFGTVVFESNNLNIEVKNSTLNAKAGEEGNVESIFRFGTVNYDQTTPTGNIHITVDGTSKIYGEGNTEFITFTKDIGSNNIVTVQRGAKTNFDIDYRYLAQDSYVNMETETVECTCPEVKEVPGKAPTCTEKGIKDSYECIDPTCGKVWYDTIIKEGDEEFEVTVEANSSADLEIPALGHKEVKVPGKAATCTETGLTEGTVCEVCKEPVKVQETIAKIEHTYKDGACTVCEAKDPNYVAPEIVVEDLPTIDPKEEVEEVVVGVNKTETTEVLTNTVEEVIESVKTGEEVVGVSSAVVTVIADAIEDEKELEITTTVVVTPVKEEEVKEETVKLIVEAADGAEVVQYLDLSVLMDVKVDGQKVVEAEEVKQLAKPMTFTIAIPEELKEVEEGYERTYFIVRVHEGKTEKLPVKVNADGTLSFSTDRFSNYALAYEDTLKTITQTGDANLIVPFVAAMLVSGAVLVLLKKREESFN